MRFPKPMRKAVAWACALGVIAGWARVGAGPLAPAAGGGRAPVEPLKDRAAKADKVFVGTLVNRVEAGGWARAHLRVDEPIKGVAKGDLVKVQWLPTVARYDAPEGQRGLALLSPRDGESYWLRSDTFDDVTLADEARRALGVAVVPPATQPGAAGPAPTTAAANLTDQQMDQLAEAAAVKAQAQWRAGRPMMPGAVPPLARLIRSENMHLGEAVFKSPFLKYRFYCATLGETPAKPVRQFIGVSRSGQVTAPFTAAAFGAALAAEDTAKWTDEQWIEAARMCVHLQSPANEDGWRLLAKPEDLTSITFNIDRFPAALAARDAGAKQVVPPAVTHEKDALAVRFHAWHLIGGRFVLWTVTMKPEVGATAKELGRFGGGGYD